MKADALFQRLTRAAAAYAVVAFDVFDTLLWRDVSAPTDVFALMERSGAAPSGFARQRVEAEQRVRQQASGREITLREIYDELPISSEAECATEQKTLRANPTMLRFVQWCRGEGKQIYVISDMYLPQQKLADLLAHCGYAEFAGIFVSSEYGVQKRSGKLFAEFLQETTLCPKQVLFVGDDRRADFAGAALAGIRCFLLPPRGSLERYPQRGAAEKAKTTVEKAYDAFFRNHFACQSEAATLGGELLGQLLTAFCCWLHEEMSAAPGRVPVFLARDMYLVQKAYQMLWPQEQTKYWKVSRRSLCPSLLEAAETEVGRRILIDALPRELLTGTEILSFLGVEPGCVGEETKQKRFDLRRRPVDSGVWALLGAARDHKAQAEEQGALAKAYLRQELAGLSAPVLVDIGSGGTTQRMAEEILGRPLEGRCLACDERLRQELPPERAKAFLFEGKPAPLWYWAGQPLLEALISEPCGATLGYRLGADGTTVLPRLARIPLPENRQQMEEGAPEMRSAEMAQKSAAFLREIQAGALRYVNEWQTSCLRNFVPTAAQAIRPFLAMVQNPGRREAEWFGNLLLEDGVQYRLAAPQGWKTYLRHPTQLKTDFENSHWKVAFLRRLCSVPGPYGTLYAHMKCKKGKS